METPKKQLKGKPRGRPWRPGESGNPKGKPKGSLNGFTRAVLEGAIRGAEYLNRPLMLDMNLPYEAWDGLYCQQGVWFHRITLLPVNPEDPPLAQREMVDSRERRSEVIWKNRRLYLQHGWPYDPSTWKALKL